MRLAFRMTLLVLLATFAFALAPVSIDAAPPSASPDTYIVQPGDTLFAIALRYNTTVAAIKQLNKLTSDTILVGQKLLIPTDATASVPPSISYIIQAGDSLYAIATRYGTTMRTLMDLNGIPNPNLIYAGQSLAIPNSEAVAKPGLIIDPPSVGQGETLMLQVARPGTTAISGTFNGKPIAFSRAAGYWYALIGISRCAKIGSVPVTITTTDSSGQTTSENAKVNVTSTAFVVQTITLPPAVSSILNNSALINSEAQQLAALVNRYTPTRLWSGAFRQPLYGGVISSQFGTRRSYNGGPVGACGHEGTDFSVSAGTPIYAPARGRVVFAGLTQVRGNLTVIDHGLGVFSAYYHQSAIDVQVGQIVEPGTLIGKVGSTGLSTGPHLHWSMWANGEYVDPMEWTKRVLP